MHPRRSAALRCRKTSTFERNAEADSLLSSAISLTQGVPRDGDRRKKTGRNVLFLLMTMPPVAGKYRKKKSSCCLPLGCWHRLCTRTDPKEVEREMRAAPNRRAPCVVKSAANRHVDALRGCHTGDTTAQGLSERRGANGHHAFLFSRVSGRNPLLPGRKPVPAPARMRSV